MERRFGLAMLAILVCGGGSLTQAADWPQWQGPERNAISREKGLLKAWAPQGPQLSWRIQGLGGGDSAPAIADGRLIGLSHRATGEVVWALSEKDGKELWVTALGDATQQRIG